MFPFELQFLKWLESIRTGFLTALFEGITIVIGVAIAFIFKESLKVLQMGNLHVDLILDALRYFAVVFAVGYLCPLLFKKIKI